jgi:hypothetical protein
MKRKFAVRGIPARAKEEMESVRSDVLDRAPLETASNSFEARIGNEMELGRDVVGRSVANESNGRRVDRRETEELTAASAGLPFGNFLAILQTRIKNIDGAAEDTGTAKVVTTSAGSAEKLDGSHTIGPRNVVIEPGGIRKCERPKACIVLVGPMDLKV